MLFSFFSASLLKTQSSCFLLGQIQMSHFILIIQNFKKSEIARVMLMLLLHFEILLLNKLYLPIFAFVLSTPMLIQLFQSLLCFSKALSIAEGNVSCLNAMFQLQMQHFRNNVSSANVACISKNFIQTLLERFTSNIKAHVLFIFLKPVSEELSFIKLYTLEASGT